MFDETVSQYYDKCKSIIIDNFSATEVTVVKNAYKISDKFYLLFLKEKVSKANIEGFLDRIENGFTSNAFPKWKTIIVVAATDEAFRKSELLYEKYEVGLTVNFYLLNVDCKNRYYDDGLTFPLSISPRKYVKSINNALREKLQ